MRNDVQTILNKHNVTIELKGYKEGPARDGYRMEGNLSVNGKKAIGCLERGDGSMFEYEILNEKNAQPLLDIMDELSTLPKYDGDEDGFEMEQLFIQYVEDLMTLKQLKSKARKKTLVKWSHDTYEEGQYSAYNHEYSNPVLNAIVNKMIEKGDETVQIWNPTQSWTSYTIDEVKALMN